MKRSSLLLAVTLTFAVMYQTAHAQATTSSAASSDSKDMAPLSKAIACNREVYQFEGLMDAINTKGYTKADVVKVLHATKQDAQTNVKALLNDLDMYTSNKYIRNAQPYIILDFVFKDCMTLR